ncbi:MAG: MazG nucleotide pyrophosphohydrolase domain-containing protein [Candidatus Bathyarchaeia archaeon]
MHVREFQDMMRQIYLHRDSKRGAKGTYEWLVDEIEELEEALRERDKDALEDEFADALAWLASLANVVNIDLEKAALAKYNNKCPKCQEIPCTCSF